MLETISAQFNQGGVFMWPILIIGAVAIAVVVDRIVYYYLVCCGNPSRMVERIVLSVREGKASDAMALVKSRRNPLFVLLHAALKRYATGTSITRIEEEIEQVAVRQLPRITNRTGYLSLFANIATLIGLLGTIAGLQESFGSLATADAAQKAVMLSSGIAQAMNTTAFGLIVAVPCMVLFTLLAGKQQSLLNDIDDSVLLVVNTMKEVRS